MGPIKVLVIDDEEHILQMIKNRLQKDGFTIDTAKNGSEGFQKAIENPPDVILLDVMLPDIDGKDLCKKLKANQFTENIPVIFLTAKNTPEEKMEEYEAGGECHIQKPFEGKELKEKILRTFQYIRQIERGSNERENTDS